MRVSYDVEVTQPLDAAWQSLTDIDGVLAAMPGAALARDGETVTGSVKCKLGSSQVTYRVTATAEVSEPGFRTAVVTVKGEEARGSGTLAAVLTLAVRAAGHDTDTLIEITGDIDATGRGEDADEQAWQRVIKLLVNAVVPPVAAVSPQEPSPPPRTPLAVAPAPSVVTGPVVPPWAALVAVLAVLLLILRRRRRS